ncbi:chemotaxis protein CheW [Novosphingobium sp. AAP83]|uniref:chemotaxis protein CheW n=1 Tax=Novosphingobium sp. AAP83 TaxID=1523425 RepID=UPI0006B8F2B2|nr:chemotaxis protein CheW [Novosphingobium sp. AAP83]KPF90850.1 chemotaxis protein CheW [Novosphingobium sp. AAP83]
MTDSANTADVQAVTFGIGQEVFAVPVPMVREVIDYIAPFRIPNGPDHFMGLIDVRGQGIPVIDLRIRFGLPSAEPTEMTRILILEVPQNGRGLTIGLLIDKALNVSTFPRASIEQSPDIGVRWQSDYIEGVVRDENGFVVLVDIARVLTTDDTMLLADVVREAA